ncbi:MAG: class I SAM-dependent methyltransferase [Rhabdochlamydiaceae bacterium]
MSKAIDCPLCNSPEHRLVRVDCGRSIVRCSACQFLYVNPQPTDDELERLYGQEYYGEGSTQVQGSLSHRLPVFQYGIEAVSKLVKPGKLLDDGCGTGEFLDLAQKFGWDAMGIELSENAGSFAVKKGLKVEIGTLTGKNYPAERFDVVTVWDVLEHLSAPRKEVEAIWRVLRPGGIVVIRVPNTQFQLMKALVREKLLKRKPDSLQADLHLNHFTPRTLRRLLESCGFEVIKNETGVSENAVYRPDVPLWLKKSYCDFAKIISFLTSMQIGPTMVQYGRKVTNAK